METWSGAEGETTHNRGFMPEFEGRTRPQVLSFLHHALQLSGQRLLNITLNHPAPFHKSHRWSEGNTRSRCWPGSQGKAVGLWTPESRHVSWCLNSSNISSRASAKLMRTRAPDQNAYFENTYFSKILHFKLNHMSNCILASYSIL